MDPVLRIIDANANRAREALRVMEDAARFALDHRDLCSELKSLRHDLVGALGPLEDGGMLSHRDTPGDVGTMVTTTSERRRGGLHDVVSAAAKRLTEALRSIEEAAKTLDTAAESTGSPRDAAPAGLSARIEALRYRAYEAEKRLVLALPPSRAGFRGWRLCVLITESVCGYYPWLDVARRAIEGGADCIQLREKSLPSGELLARARALVELAHPLGAAVVINDRVDIALLCGADGVHVGQEDLPVADVRAVAGFRLIVGVSTATIEQARAALHTGAEVCGVGPMFPSTTKEKSELSGPAYLRAYLAHDPALPPALAISGVTRASIPELVEAAGAKRFGVAVSSAVCAARDPAQAAAELRAALGPPESPASAPLITASPARRLRTPPSM